MKVLHITIIAVLAIGISTGTVYATSDYYANLQSALNERERFASDEVYRNTIYQQHADHFDSLTTDEAKKAAYTELALEHKEGILDFVAYENRHLYIETEIEKMLGLPLLSHAGFSDVSYLEKLKEKLDNKNTKIDAKKSKVADLKSQLEIKTKQNDELQSKLDQKNRKVDRLENKIEELKEKVDRKNTKLDNKKEKLDAMNVQGDEIKTQLEEAKIMKTFIEYASLSDSRNNRASFHASFPESVTGFPSQGQFIRFESHGNYLKSYYSYYEQNWENIQALVDLGLDNSDRHIALFTNGTKAVCSQNLKCVSSDEGFSKNSDVWYSTLWDRQTGYYNIIMTYYHHNYPTPKNIVFVDHPDLPYPNNPSSIRMYDESGEHVNGSSDRISNHRTYTLTEPGTYTWTSNHGRDNAFNGTITVHTLPN